MWIQFTGQKKKMYATPTGGLSDKPSRDAIEVEVPTGHQIKKEANCKECNLRPRELGARCKQCVDDYRKTHGPKVD